jgi:hypothetical protein
MRLTSPRLHAAFASTILSLALIGCSLSPTAAPIPEAGSAIRGLAHGGQQPISGGHVYLFAAGTSGYGGASTSLLDSTKTGHSDSVGAYVLTGSDGGFTITGDYTCTQNTQVYIYILGGNSGGGTNSALGLMAILGNCPSGGSLAAAVPFAYVNEVTTIAAAYAFAGFATDATHVSSSGSSLAQIGIANAFANAANLVTLSTGAALATTSAGNGTVPQTHINTLANMLAACVNSTGTFTACTTLFANALSSGTTGTTPTDTATAAINIAHNPVANMAALYGLSTPNKIFNPALASQPGDFIIGLKFTGGGANTPWGIAIDGSGNAWIANYSSIYGISKFSSTGAALSPASGYTGGGLDVPDAIAIDSSGNAWVANKDGNGISEFSSAGIALSGSTGYTGGGLNTPDYCIAIDGSDNAWIANYGNSSISKYSSAGAAVSSSAGYTGGGLGEPMSIAIDSSGNVWIANHGPTLSKFSGAGTAYSGPGGYTGGGLSTPDGIAIDAAGNVWVTNFNVSTGSSLSKFSNAGAALSGSGWIGGGINEPDAVAIDGAGNAWIGNSNGYISEFSNTGTAVSESGGYSGSGGDGIADSTGIAIDGSGNVWTSNQVAGGYVGELIGAAVPVVTPLAVGVANNTLGTRP